MSGEGALLGRDEPAGETPTGDGLLVRLAHPDEYDAIDRLAAEAYARDYGPSDESGDPMRRAEVRARGFEVWVAVDAGSGALLGTVTLRASDGPPLHEDFAPDELDLRLLAVSPSARRRGVGTALMRHAAVRADEGGFAAVALKTALNMVGAHRLYEALGYRRAPERDGLWIGGEKVLDLRTYLQRLRD